MDIRLFRLMPFVFVFEEYNAERFTAFHPGLNIQPHLFHNVCLRQLVLRADRRVIRVCVGFVNDARQIRICLVKLIDDLARPVIPVDVQAPQFHRGSKHDRVRARHAAVGYGNRVILVNAVDNKGCGICHAIPVFHISVKELRMIVIFVAQLPVQDRRVVFIKLDIIDISFAQQVRASVVARIKIRDHGNDPDIVFRAQVKELPCRQRVYPDRIRALGADHLQIFFLLRRAIQHQVSQPLAPRNRRIINAADLIVISHAFDAEPVIDKTDGRHIRRIDRKAGKVILGDLGLRNAECIGQIHKPHTLLDKDNTRLHASRVIERITDLLQFLALRRIPIQFVPVKRQLVEPFILELDEQHVQFPSGIIVSSGKFDSLAGHELLNGAVDRGGQILFKRPVEDHGIRFARIRIIRIIDLIDNALGIHIGHDKDARLIVDEE